MDLKLQPKPEVEILPSNRGIVSRKEFFVKKKFEEINQYFFAGHFVRNWKPKTELIYPQLSDEETIQYEYDFNRDVQNCFVEDFAEEVFLRTPPPCFVVFGKFKREVNKLCEKLSNEYGSVLIQVDDIVNQVIKENTETGKLVDRILRLGVSLTLNFLLTLVSYVAHTPEARHRGYVLSGLPCLPLSCDLPVEQQFHYLFTWDNKPTFFINVLFNDEDLIKQRTNLRVTLRGEGENKYFQFYSVYQWTSDDDEESDIDDEMLPINENPPPIEPDIDISPSRPWAQLPGDEESRVWCEFEQFDNIIRPAIELIMSRVDPQYFMTLDSRVPNDFEVVQARLKLLQVWKVPVPIPFLLPRQKSEILGEDEEGQEEDEGDPNDDDYLIRKDADKPPQVGFLTLFSKKTPSPKFRWELSHYNYICPVNLREGAIVEGKTKFAVGFMKYIYFLHDQECMARFLKNPRAYVLPIRPKPLCRFIILGYPLSGKTSLAEALAKEFSIPLIDVNRIVEKDLLRKKETYQEFCRQKAECREITRLTAQAWQDWRLEEERRINLIEEWIIYIQTLLNRRIKLFYSGGQVDEIPEKVSAHHQYVESTENSQMESEDSIRSGESERRRGGEKESLEVRGTPIYVSRPSAEQNASTPSNKLIKAMKHEDFDFNKNGLEVEANLFFSSLWNSFSGATHPYNTEKVRHSEEEFGEFGGEAEEFEENIYETNSVNWCGLLPPQSLSSFLMTNKPYTAREKRQSFKIFLEAASKVYWEPSALKSEFAKWRLPCFMDIPLCEVFLDNPILLLKYLPEWLKERPLIPDPIDTMHPSVLEASRTAFVRAQVVNIKQTKEEVGILLIHAIEKAEREAMRVTGEVISPGGWVVDNMSLDVEVWNKLACENVFPDHVYILIDTEPDYRRILNIWWEQCGAEYSEDLEDSLYESKRSISEVEKKKETNISRKFSLTTENRTASAVHAISSNTSTHSVDVIKLLIDSLKTIQEGNIELDTHYRSLLKEKKTLPEYLYPILPPGGQSLTFGNAEKAALHREDSFGEDVAFIQSTSDMFISTTGLLTSPKMYLSSFNMPLGTPLETVTNAFLNFLNKKPKADVEEPNDWTVECGLQFLYFLLTLPKKLERVKEWLTNLSRGITVTEIEITGKDPETMISDIRKDLMKPFIKKPRELENFEIEEIKKSSVEEILKGEENYEDEILESGELEEDVRIFGESGSLCIVNLERDIFVLGKMEHALRYYGKLYYFWNEDAKNKFIEDPEKYAPYYSAIRCYPPLRIFITGPVGSGKTTLADSLSHQCGIPNVCFPTFLINNLVPHFNYEKLSLLTDQKLLLSENHNAEAKKARDMFLNAPSEYRQFWIESSVYLDFLDEDTVLQRIMQVQQPVDVMNYPELIYLCVESVPQKDNLEEMEDSQLSKIVPPVPQAPYASMKEIETIITNYLKENSDLNDYCIEKSFKTLWTEKPYITQGFVLEDFPKRSYDVKTITNNNWIPDLVLELVVPENEVIDRNIDNLMELWMTKLKRETVDEKLLEDTVTNIYNAWKHIKRDKLFNEKRAEAMKQLENLEVMKSEERASLLSVKKSGFVLHGKMPSKSAIKNMGFSEHQLTVDMYNLPESVNAGIEAEIAEILNKEMPPLVFNPNFETYDAGKARIIENIIKTYRKDCGTIEKIKTPLKEAGVSWLEIDGLKNLNETLIDLYIKFNEIRKRLMYKGEFAFTMTMEMAEKLLQQGYYFLSKFGRWCPVQVYRMKNPIHMFRPFSARGKVTPIAYRNYIYFVAGENEKAQFLEDPIKYTFNEPHHPNIPLRIAVIGPPKSGKTTLCTRLGIMFDLKVITMGSALRYALEITPATTLARSIKSFLKRGCFLPLSLKMEALMICLCDPSCYTQGFILDGIPFNAALTQSLAEKGKLPFVIISLVADSNFGKINRERLDLKQFRLQYKNRTNLDTRYLDWNKTYKRFAQWNQATYNNLYEVNAKLSVVDIFYQAYDIIRKSFFAILYYVEYCVSGRVLPLQYLCVSQHEYELRRSSFHNNCPVCWVEKNKLVFSSDPPSRSGLVQYGNHFYWVCIEDMQKFIENPKIYFLPYAPKGPDLLPKRLKKSVFEADPKMEIHGCGRCPVTRIDFPSALDWEGSWNFAACYANEAFLCKNEEMLNRFLARPWRYYKADTQYESDQRFYKSKAVENLGPPKMTSLPPIGFLEQTVADLIHDCLQLLGSVRPIYPNMSPSVTGCIFVALYLKVYNKRNKSPHLERHYLHYMIHSCKAFNFEVSCIRPQLQKQMGQGDSEMDGSDESDISIVSDTSKCSGTDPKICHDFMDSAQTEKKIWSAKKISEKFTEMKLTLDDELQEIPVHPKAIAMLQFESQKMRTNPIPPISHCLTFIYSVKPPLEVPEKFNYNTLYQPIMFCTPSSKMLFNPDKRFSMPLYRQEKPSYPSNPNLHQGQRVLSNITIREPREKSDPTPEYLMQRYIPRFKFLDVLIPSNIPSVPQVVPDIALAYNPQRDYSYTILLSEFFYTTHVLRSYESNEQYQYLEFSNRLDNTLALTRTKVEYMHKPRVKPSEISRTSLDSYQQIFDAASLFVVGSVESDVSITGGKKKSVESTIYNFIQTLLFEKLDQLFENLYYSTISYDMFDITIAPISGKRDIVIMEVVPYPPLPWDIICRPYHAYRSISSLFKKPMLENIAHERQFSLLDGIIEPNVGFRFLQIPGNLRDAQEVERFLALRRDEAVKPVIRKKSSYFVFDFFNIPWSSFLTYTHSGTIYQEISEFEKK